MKKTEVVKGENEILEMVEAALSSIKADFGDIPSEDPNIAFLLVLKNKAKKNDYMGIIEMGVLKFKDKPIKIGIPGKRPTLQDKLDAEAVELSIAEYSNLLDKSKPVKKYEDQKELNKRIRELKSDLSQISHEELIDMAAKSLVEFERNTQIIMAQQEHIQFLEKKFMEARSKLKTAVQNRIVGKEKVYKNNNDCLKYCYQGFAKSLERPVISSDYPAYKRFLLGLYEKPPFVPKVRSTKEEKRKSKQTQSEDRSLKQKDEWKDPTIRDAFEKFSGVKATTLKK